MAQEKGGNMAQEKGKNIVTEPPMNPPPRLSPVPSGTKPRGCQGDGCASDPDTWPLHHMLHGGVHCFLCCSCILLSHRSLYCCRCFFLVTSPSSNDDDGGDPLMARPAPTITCQVCREAVAHLRCPYHEAADAADGVFVCPPCTAAQNVMPFTYAPRCLQPIDERGARILVLAGRIALELLREQATAARANAERLALEARDARKIAVEALNVAYDLAKKEDPSWVPPQSPENDLAVSEEGGMEAEANVAEGLRVRLNAIPSLATLTIGTAGASSSVVPMALTEAKHTNEAKAVQAEPRAHQALNSFNVKEVAMAAAEAARDSPSTPQTLQLFPGAMASSSTKMPRTTAKKPRTKRPRTLQLFKKGT